MSDELKASFALLGLEAQAALLPELAQLHATAKQTKVDELKAQLAALGVTETKRTRGPNKTKADATRAPAEAKYRSLKNPELVWSGRGALAGWLKAEMAESGKPKEAFLIK
jgi:DNA-binding protein H-NS